jgi:hypothetical protein
MPRISVRQILRPARSLRLVCTRVQSLRLLGTSTIILGILEFLHTWAEPEHVNIASKRLTTPVASCLLHI